MKNNNDFYSYEPNSEFREHIGDIIRDLECQLVLKSPLVWNKVIKNWFKNNFEQFHINTSVSTDLINHYKGKIEEYEKYQDEHAICKLADGLTDIAVFKTKLDYPRNFKGEVTNPYIKEKTHSIIVMRNKK